MSRRSLKYFVSRALGRVCLLAIGVFGLSAADASVTNGLYESDTDPFTVVSESLFTLYDSNRAWNVQMRVTYPAATGSFPVILFGHKFGGTKDPCLPLITNWAARGYVCVQPNHSDSPQVGGPTPTFNTEDRAADMAFLMDSFDAIEAGIPSVSGKLDRAHLVRLRRASRQRQHHQSSAFRRLRRRRPESLRRQSLH